MRKGRYWYYLWVGLGVGLLFGAGTAVVCFENLVMPPVPAGESRGPLPLAVDACCGVAEPAIDMQWFASGKREGAIILRRGPTVGGNAVFYGIVGALLGKLVQGLREETW